MPQAGPRTAAPSREAFPSWGGAACQPGAWWLELCLRKNKKALRKAALCTSPALRGERRHHPWSCPGTSPLWGQALRGARCLPCLPPAQTGPREKSWGRLYPHGRVLLLQVKPCPARMAAALGRGCLFTPVRWVPAWGPPAVGLWAAVAPAACTQGKELGARRGAEEGERAARHSPCPSSSWGVFCAQKPSRNPGHGEAAGAPVPRELGPGVLPAPRAGAVLTLGQNRPSTP